MAIIRNPGGHGKRSPRTRPRLGLFTPFRDGRPERLEPWYPSFIIALAKYGRITLAAGMVQVHRRVAYAHIAKNPALSGEVRRRRRIIAPPSEQRVGALASASPC